jgi:hypothetical protein
MKHRGLTLDSVLRAEGLYDELKSVTVKEAISWQLEKSHGQEKNKQKEIGRADEHQSHAS